LRVLVFLLLLAVLAGVVRQFPFLWELALAGLFGGVWWCFFRSPPDRPDR
jgi:hypothetical protein